ncbi:hypothetical protein ABBQ32_002363 [Trebouxia sp. C0010 RCD-2024]
MQRITVTADSLTCPVATAYLGPSEPGEVHKDQPPVLLLHGFDSSSLEFRRLLPLLEKKLETWAVDLVGWGFSDSGAATRKDIQLGPQQKRDHLYAFWKEKVMLACTVPKRERTSDKRKQLQNSSEESNVITEEGAAYVD